MSFKKLLFVMLVIIVGMFSLMLTTSYAWYSYENASTTFEGMTNNDDILVSYQSGEYINTSIAVPISSGEVDKYSEKSNFNISVKNNKENNEIMVSVSLTEVVIADELKNSNFIIELYYQGSKLTTVTGNNVSSGTDIDLGDVILDSDTSNQFEVRVYILDNGADQGTMMNKEFRAKIMVDVLSRLKTSFTDYDSEPDIYVSAITVDGETSDYIPTSGYYSMTSSCTKGSTLSWEPLSKTITYESGSYVQDVCSLTFTPNTNYPLLNTMPVGSYVKYVGKGGMVGDTIVACQNNGSASSSTLTAETEAPNSCLGQNAREDIDENGNTYGYCYSAGYRYYTTGWRIAYIDSNDKPVIVSGGSPECNARTSSTANVTYIKMANSKALKYCNSDYVDGDCSCVDADSDGYCDCTDSDSDGLCDEIENGDLDAWAISDLDFYNMTKAISGVGKRLYSGSSVLGDSGGTLGTTLYCGGYYSREECGYNNDLIDNGGYYWFAARYISSYTDGVNWDSNNRYVNSSSSTLAFGLRPVISLSSSVVVTGGAGTIDDPYEIANNTFSINDGSKYINSSDDRSNVTLNLIALSDVTQMCINADSSGCSNYVDYASTYTLDWSSESDGEKIVYVYYKNASGDVVASMNETVVIDTVVPSNNSVTFVDGDGLNRTLTLSSTGADYMCFSNTSNSASDCTKWVAYATSYSWKLELGTGDKTIYAFFKDKAGNVVGPYSASTTCTNDCTYKYFVDAYSNSYINLMRNDGATARVSTSTTDVTWYSPGSQDMKVCGTDNYYTTSGYIWCIGADNNAYYKTSYSATSWNKVSISSYIDTSTYTYSLYPYSKSYAYIVRSDGKTNRISTSGLYSTSWTYGYSQEMAVCSGYYTSRVVCIASTGYYYYKTSYASTTAWTGGSIVNLTDRTNANTWIDMYQNASTDIIESDGTNLYNTRFSYSTSSADWYTSDIPGDGVKTCATTGNSTYNICLGEDGYLYYKSYSSTSWTKSSVVYE